MSRVSTQSILDEVYGGTATGGGSSIDDILGEVYGATPNVAAATPGVALPRVPSNIDSPLGALSYMGGVVNAVAPQQANPPADTWLGRYFAGYANTLADFPSDVVRAGQALLQPAPGEMVKPDPYRVTGQQLGQIAGIVDQGTAMTKQAMGMPGLKPGGIPEAIGGGAANLGTQVVLGLATGGGSLPAQAGGFALGAAAPVVGQTMRDASNELGPGNEQRAAGEALTAGGITAATSLLPGAAILQKAGGGAIVQKLLGIAQKSVGRRVGTAMLAEGGQELIEGVGQDFATRTMRRDESITPQMAMDILTDPQRAMDFALGAGLGGVARVPFEVGGSNAAGQNNPVGQTQNVPGTNGTVSTRGGPVQTDASTVVPGGNAPQPSPAPAVTNVDPAGAVAAPDVTDEELAAMTDEEAARLFAESEANPSAQTAAPIEPTSQTAGPESTAWFIPPEQARRDMSRTGQSDSRSNTPLASDQGLQQSQFPRPDSVLADEQGKTSEAIQQSPSQQAFANPPQDASQGSASVNQTKDELLASPAVPGESMAPPAPTEVATPLRRASRAGYVADQRALEKTSSSGPTDTYSQDGNIRKNSRGSTTQNDQASSQSETSPNSTTAASVKPLVADGDGVEHPTKTPLTNKQTQTQTTQPKTSPSPKPAVSPEVALPIARDSSPDSTPTDLAALSKKAQSPVTIADDAKLTTTEKAHRDRAGKGFGRRIVFVDTKANVEGAIVGSTPTTLYVKRGLGGKRLTPVVAHEALHSMQRTNPELAGEVIDAVGRDKVLELGRKQMEQQADAGYAADADENTLLDEGLARLGEEIAASRPEVASRLLETPGLWERFKTWIQSTLNKVGITRGSQEWTAVARALDKLESEHRKAQAEQASKSVEWARTQAGVKRKVDDAYNTGSMSEIQRIGDSLTDDADSENEAAAFEGDITNFPGEIPPEVIDALGPDAVRKYKLRGNRGKGGRAWDSYLQMTPEGFKQAHEARLQHRSRKARTSALKGAMEPEAKFVAAYSDLLDGKAPKKAKQAARVAELRGGDIVRIEGVASRVVEDESGYKSLQGGAFDGLSVEGIEAIPVDEQRGWWRAESGEAEPADAPKEEAVDIPFSAKRQEFIDVDGTQRPTMNSDGKPIANTDDAIRAFWRWFGDSKVVDGSGRPKIMYHGGSTAITTFDERHTGGAGFYFTPDVQEAMNYARGANSSPDVLARVSRVYLAVANPADNANVSKALNGAGGGNPNRIANERLKQSGFDGRMRPDGVVAVFGPLQIKSVENKGTFSKDNPDIRFSARKLELRGEQQQGMLGFTSGWAAPKKSKEPPISAKEKAELYPGIRAGETVSQYEKRMGTADTPTMFEDAPDRELKQRPGEFDDAYASRLAEAHARKIVDEPQSASLKDISRAMGYLSRLRAGLVARGMDGATDKDAARQRIASIDREWDILKFWMKQKEQGTADTPVMFSARKPADVEAVFGDRKAIQLSEKIKRERGTSYGDLRGIGTTPEDAMWWDARKAVHSELRDSAQAMFGGDKELFAYEASALGSGRELRINSKYKLPNMGDIRFSAKLPDTIDVDGKQRPTTNSDGKPIARTAEEVRNFWRWFADSKVVDKDGKPLVVYHGTGADFNEFVPSESGNAGPGIYTTDNKQDGSEYATEDAANVKSLYMRMNNPVSRSVYDALFAKEDRNYESGDYQSPDSVKSRVHRSLVLAGYDGRVIQAKNSTHYVAFSPNQIKSATGNKGTFDAANADIRFSARNEDQKKYSYGFHGRLDGKDPAKTGYVTLTSDGKRNYAYGEDSRGGTMYEVRGNVKPVQASDIAKRVFHKLKADDPPFLSGVDLSYEGFLNSFDVGNIVDSAGWWDDPAFVSWFWENYQIPLVETKSGHVVLDPTEVTYNKVSNDDIRFSAKRDPAAQAAHDNAMNLEAEKGRRKSEVSAARTTAAIERRGAEAAQKETRDTIKNREKREKAFVTLVQQQQAENAQLSVQLGDASAEIQARRSAMKNMLSVITNAQRDLKRAAVNIQKAKDKAAARDAANETAARVRDAVVEIAKQLPPSLRGRMLTDVRDSVDMADLLGAEVSGKTAGGNRATQTFGALGKAADLLIRYNGREAKAEIVKMTKPRAMGKLSEKARKQIRELIADYDRLFRQTQAPIAPASRADAAEQLVKIADDVRAIVRQHQLENKIIRWGRIADAMVVRNEVIESAKLASPELPFERKNPQLRQQPGALKRWFVHDDRRADVLMRLVDNDPAGNGPLATIIERPIRDGVDKRYELIESVTNISNEFAKDAGFEDIADLRAKASGTLGEGLQKFETVQLGGKDHRLSWGTLAKLVSSFDDVNLGERLRKGRPVTFRSRENQTPIQLTTADEQAIRDAMPAELYRVVKGMKRLRDQTFPLVQAAQRVVSGREAPSQPGYEPIITNRDQAAFAAEADPFDANFETKLIENSGFLKERVNDTTTPIIIGDFFQDFDRSIRNAADAAFLMIPLRNAREVLLKPDVGNAISERFGEEALDRIRGAVRGVVKPPPEGNPLVRTLNKLERNTKVSLTAINPGSLTIAALAPMPRVIAEIGWARTMKGVRTLGKKGVRSQMLADSPWLRARSAGTVTNINSMLPQIEIAPVDMELDASMAERWGEVKKAVKRGGRAWVQNMIVAARDVKAGDFGEAGKNVRQAFTRGTSSIAEQIRFQSFIDSKVAQVIWEGTREPGDTKEQHRRRAEEVALRILPRSDSFAQTAWSERINQSGLSSFAPFRSDANTAINHLTLAWKQDRKKGLQVTAGFLAAALVSALIKGSEAMLRAGLGGDDEEERWARARDAALLRLGSETVGVPFMAGAAYDLTKDAASAFGGNFGGSIAASPVTKTAGGLAKATKAIADKLSSTDPKKVDSAMSRMLDGLLQAAEGLGQATKQPGTGLVPYVRAAAKGVAE